MDNLLYKRADNIAVLTLNRPEKSNAFDEQLLQHLLINLENANADPLVDIILLNANGKHFSAGADIAWMQRMVEYSEAENHADAKILADVMFCLYNSPKPTLAVVQGAVYGGGIGLVAACDIAISANNAKFCFSEVKLGLIPAVISPYVVAAIGARLSKWLFITAEQFSAAQALQYNLIHYCVDEQELEQVAFTLAKRIRHHGPMALKACKTLVDDIEKRPIDAQLIHETADLIAKIRCSTEAQLGLKAFLNKTPPNWDSSNV